MDKQERIRQLLSLYQPPRCPDGEHEVTLHPDWANDEPVVCHFEYVLGEPATFDHPGDPGELNLTCAYVRGWDCYRLLDEKLIAELEEQILARHNELEYEP